MSNFIPQTQTRCIHIFAVSQQHPLTQVCFIFPGQRLEGWLSSRAHPVGKACCRAPLFLCSLQPTSPQWVRRGLVLHGEEVTPPRGGLFPAFEHSSSRCLVLRRRVFSALISWQSSLCCRDSGSGRPGRLGWVVWKWASKSPSSVIDAALPDTWCCFRECFSSSSG